MTTFGSVPLKTYLPDGDVDLSLIAPHLAADAGWTGRVRAALEAHAATLQLTDVTVINAEVRSPARQLPQRLPRRRVTDAPARLRALARRSKS